LDPVELTAELVQGIGHGYRRKAYRGPGAEALFFHHSPRRRWPTINSLSLEVHSHSPLFAPLGANRGPESREGRKSTRSRRRPVRRDIEVSWTDDQGAWRVPEAPA